MEKPMTPREALDFLDAACASVAMGHPAHVKGMQAVAILSQFIPIDPVENAETDPKTEEANADD